MSLRLDFNAGTVKQDLATLIEKMKEAALDELDEVSSSMVSIAYSLCHKDTGALAASIRKERHGDTFNVRAGGYVYNPKTGQIVNYAAIIESKYPFMRPAFDTVMAGIDDRIKNRVLEKAQP